MRSSPTLARGLSVKSLATSLIRTTSSVLQFWEKQRFPRDREDQDDKRELTSALHDAFAYCNRAYDSLTDANANQTVKAFGQERLAQLGASRQLSGPYATERNPVRPPATEIRNNGNGCFRSVCSSLLTVNWDKVASTRSQKHMTGGT